MKTVSYDLELKLTETARKHGVVLPASYKYYNGFDKNSLCTPDNERTFGLRGFTVKNVDTGECVSISDDCNAIRSHTADELMDWFIIVKKEIQIMNDIWDDEIQRYQVSFYDGRTRAFIDLNDAYHFEYSLNLADALAQMAIWLIENGYVK